MSEISISSVDLSASIIKWCMKCRSWERSSSLGAQVSAVHRTEIEFRHLAVTNLPFRNPCVHKVFLNGRKRNEEAVSLLYNKEMSFLLIMYCSANRSSVSIV